MRSIKQRESSFISVKAHDTTDESGLFIQKSSKARVTEMEASGGVFVGHLEKGVTDLPPSPDHAWCSNGHFVHKRAFGMVKGLPDRYCRQCRAEQQAKWRATQKR